MPIDNPDNTDPENVTQEKSSQLQAMGENAENVNEVSGEMLEAASRSWKADKTYEGFTGRGEQLKKILENLSSPGAKPLNIRGLGGMGKTTLAIRAIEILEQENHFEFVAWSSAKKKIFAEQLQIENKEGSSSEYSFESLLNDIARQCNRLDIAILPLDQKKRAIENLLKSHRILVVMDNMESVPDANQYLDELFALIETNKSESKILITSRHEVFSKNVEDLELEGFSMDESRYFIDMFANERGILAAIKLSIENKDIIHTKAGGAPLALRLILGQMTLLTLEQILNNLGEIINSKTSYDFYRFMYLGTWRILHEQSKYTIVDFTNFAINEGAERSELMEVSALPDGSPLTNAALDLALNQLLATSLINSVIVKAKVKDGEDFKVIDKIYYKVHPLTYNFIFSEVTGDKEWDEGLEDY